MDFDKTCKNIFFGVGKELIRFDQNFKVTRALLNVQNRVSVPYILNQQMEFDQTGIQLMAQFRITFTTRRIPNSCSE